MPDLTLEEWRDRLYPELCARRSAHARLRRYYEGNHLLPTAPDRASDKYLRLAELGITNLCGLVVDTVVQRLEPTGIRMSEDRSLDLEAWREVWQGNDLDADVAIAFEEALKVGRGFLLAFDDEGTKRVTIEDADEMIVAYAPGSRRKRVAALKAYTEGKTEFVTVWDAKTVVSWSRAASRKRGGWEPVGEEAAGEHGFTSVPVLELLSRPDVKGRPKPEISTTIIRLQDRINKLGFDAVVATEDGAFPQRYSIGVEIETVTTTDDNGIETTTAVNPLKSGPSRVWALKAEDGASPSIGQLAPYPTDDLMRMLESSVRHLGWISQTSALFMLGGSANVGADMVRALDAGQVAKVKAHQRVFGETLEDLFALMSPDSPADIEIVWAPIESRSLAEEADAKLKLSQAGDSPAEIAERLGDTQSEIARSQAERDAPVAPLPPAAVPPVV